MFGGGATILGPSWMGAWVCGWVGGCTRVWVCVHMRVHARARACAAILELFGGHVGKGHLGCVDGWVGVRVCVGVCACGCTRVRTCARMRAPSWSYLGAIWATTFCNTPHSWEDAPFKLRQRHKTETPNRILNPIAIVHHTIQKYSQDHGQACKVSILGYSKLF